MNSAERAKNDITVTVFAPNTEDPMDFVWAKTTKVGEAALEAAQAFGYEGGNPTFVKDEDVLDRQKPLVAAGVRDADEVELVDFGGGV